MKHPSYRSFIAAPIVLVLGLGACSSDSKSSAKTTASAGSTAGSTADSAATGDGNKASYCAFVSGIETAFVSATSNDQAIAVMKAFEPKMDQVIADAPAALKAGAQLQVDDARKAIAANDATLSNTAENQTAAAAGDAYCGITATASAPSGGLTTTIPATVNS